MLVRLLGIMQLTAKPAALERSFAAGEARLQEFQQELDVLNVQKGKLQDSLIQRTAEAAKLKVCNLVLIPALALGRNPTRVGLLGVLVVCIALLTTELAALQGNLAARSAMF